MTVPTLQIDIYFKTSANTAASKLALDTAVGIKPLQGRGYYYASTDERGIAELAADLRFTTTANRDTVRDAVINRVVSNSTIKAQVIKGIICWHACTHDDPVILQCNLQPDWHEVII